MPARILKLVAPNSLPVLGFLLEDGSICQTEFTYDPVTKLRNFKLIERGDSELVKQNDQDVMVDSSGKHWGSADVALHTIFHS
jgi:hypothetical protein